MRIRHPAPLALGAFNFTSTGGPRATGGMVLITNPGTVSAPVAAIQLPTAAGPITSTTGFQTTVTPASAPFASGSYGTPGGGSFQFAGGSMFGDNPGYSPPIDYANLDQFGNPKKKSWFENPLLLAALIVSAAILLKR